MPSALLWQWFSQLSVWPQASVKEVRGVIEEQFNILMAAVEQAKKEVSEILEVEERQALQQAEGIRVHLEQRCTELKKTQTQVKKITKNKNDIDFLQVWGLFPVSWWVVHDLICNTCH